MVQTVEIRGDFDKQDGSAQVAGKLQFQLTARDFDGDIVVEPFKQEVALAADGTFAGVKLWPNDRGRKGTHYTVTYFPNASGNGQGEKLTPNIFVPSTGSPHQLADLLFAGQAAAAAKVPALIPISRAEYDAKLAAGMLQNAIYLIEVA